jgi:hypothetical protein
MLRLRWAHVSLACSLKKTLPSPLNAGLPEFLANFVDSGCRLWCGATWTAFESGPIWPFRDFRPLGSCAVGDGSKFLPWLYIEDAMWLGFYHWSVSLPFPAHLLPALLLLPTSFSALAASFALFHTSHLGVRQRVCFDLHTFYIGYNKVF